MTKKNGPNIGHNKKSFLNNPVEHIDITSFDARKIIEGMGKMSFTSRDTAIADKIYNEIISDDNCSIFLTIEIASLNLMKVFIFPSNKGLLSMLTESLNIVLTSHSPL